MSCDVDYDSKIATCKVKKGTSADTVAKGLSGNYTGTVVN